MIMSLLLSVTAFADGGRIHKWVDDKGVTHYGDKMPATDMHRDNSVLNKQGVVIKRNQVNAKSHEVDQEALEQKRRDRALRASYTTEDEIDLARDRNLQMNEVTLQALEQRKAGALKRLESGQKSADGFTKRQKPVPEDLSKELEDTKAEIDRIDQQIDEQKSSMDLTRKQYNDDKQRFIELKTEQGNTN